MSLLAGALSNALYTGGVKPPPSAVPWLGLTLAASATLSIGWGVWLTFGDTAGEPTTGTEVSGSGPQPPAGGAAPGAAPGGAAIGVRSSGTWTQDAPTEKSPAQAGALCAGCDIVVVTVCSLRRDHTGPYQSGESLTPALDALVAGGFRMDQAWSGSNFTLASLSAVLTGRFGSSTGVIGWDKGLVADVPTLPEVLGYYGYRTGAFTTDAPSGFRPDYGLDRGFQLMEIIAPPRDNPDGRSRGGEIGPGGAAAKPAARWIAEQPKDKPIFAMFHTRTAHYPFVLNEDATDLTGVTDQLYNADKAMRGQGRAMPGGAGGTEQRGVVSFTSRDPVQDAVRAQGAAGIAMWRQRYREAVHWLDRDFEVLAEGLAARGNLDRTVFVVLADHGESLDDHNELLHGDAYYDNVVHVPMLVKVPGLPGRPISALVSQVDLMPTILDLVGAVAPADADGVSMVPLFTDTAASIRTTALVEGGVVWHSDGHLRGAVVAPPWVLIRQDPGCDGGDHRVVGEPGRCLYNLETDPGQTRNEATRQPEVVAELQGRWDKFRAAKGTAGAQLKLDPAYVEELRKNGYNFQPDPP